MDAQKGHDGEIKTHKGSRHVGVSKGSCKELKYFISY